MDIKNKNKECDVVLKWLKRHFHRTLISLYTLRTYKLLVLKMAKIKRICEQCYQEFEARRPSDIKNGRIELDADFAKEIGFTSDKFDGWLWLEDGYVIISFIISKQKKQGNINKLFDAIFDKGFSIKVPTPTKAMKIILFKKGFDESFEYDDCGQPVEVWVKLNEIRTYVTSANIIEQRGQCYE